MSGWSVDPRRPSRLREFATDVCAVLAFALILLTCFASGSL